MSQIYNDGMQADMTANYYGQMTADQARRKRLQGVRPQAAGLDGNLRNQVPTAPRRDPGQPAPAPAPAQPAAAPRPSVTAAQQPKKTFAQMQQETAACCSRVKMK